MDEVEISKSSHLVRDLDTRKTRVKGKVEMTQVLGQVFQGNKINFKAKDMKDMLVTEGR